MRKSYASQYANFGSLRKISPYLKLMADRKIIDRTSQTQRGGIYTITDPLFKLWLQTNV